MKKALSVILISILIVCIMGCSKKVDDNISQDISSTNIISSQNNNR